MSTTFLIRFDCNTEECDYHTVLAGLGRVEATERLQKMGWLLLQYGTFTPSNDRHLCPGCAKKTDPTPATILERPSVRRKER